LCNKPQAIFVLYYQANEKHEIEIFSFANCLQLPQIMFPSLGRGFSFQVRSKHETGVVCIEILTFRSACRARVCLGQLLALYNCMIFVVHEIRTFLRQYTKRVNEHQFGDCFMLVFFAGTWNHFIEGIGTSMVK